MRVRKSTMVELVQELEKIQPRTQGIAIMIAEAKAGEYHDYKNQKYDCGKVAVVQRLRLEGLSVLAKSVIDGDFDEEADDEDLAMMKSENPFLFEALDLGRKK